MKFSILLLLVATVAYGRVVKRSLDAPERNSEVKWKPLNMKVNEIQDGSPLCAVVYNQLEKQLINVNVLKDEAIKFELKETDPGFKVIRTVLNPSIKTVCKEKVNNDDYSKPNWAVIWSGKPLDFELQNLYRLTLQPYIVSRSTGEVVYQLPKYQYNVEVVDQDEFHPEFSKSEYSFNLTENKSGFIGKARAIDKDEEAKPKDKRYENVEHTIISGDDRHYFTIDLGTGEITTTEEFDYEQKRSYVFKIKAENSLASYNMKKPAKATVTVHIVDVNDNAPVFPPGHETAINVVENSAIGSNVFQFKATDLDTLPANKDVIYTLMSGDTDYFRVSREGVLSVNKELDYEEGKRKMHIRVQASNEAKFVGGGVETAEIDFTINLVDINEPPVVLKTVFNVHENLAIGSKVGTVEVKDPENPTSSNDQFKWSITGDQSEFSINANGVIRTKIILDHESSKQHSFELKVEDKRGAFAEPTIRVNVIDQNDHEPFLKKESDLHMCVNRAGDNDIPIVVGRLEGDDHDSDKINGLLSFGFDQGTENSRLFSLQTDAEGKYATVVATKAFKEYTEQEYNLTYTLSDGGSPKLSTSLSLTIQSCQCGAGDTCEELAAFASGGGLGWNILLIVIACLILIGIIIGAVILKRREQDNFKPEILDEDDVRDGFGGPVEGGGEEDNRNFDFTKMMAVLQPEAPIDRTQMKCQFNGNDDLAAQREHVEIEKYQQDNSPSNLPYDSVQVYGYEGCGSVASSLSSIASGTESDDQDYDYLNDWGPKFQKLAHLYGSD